MLKRIFGKKLSRSRTARDALIKSLLRELIKHGRITTTYTKAKVLVRYLDKLMAVTKQNNVAARRRIAARQYNDKEIVDLLYRIRLKNIRQSGFAKYTLLPPRRGDMAPMARVELLDWEQKETVVKSQKVNKKSESKKLESKKDVKVNKSL